jgi:hypothetical protein
MVKWWEKYIGLPFEDNVFDCGELVIVVQREQFGRTVYLPVERKDYTLAEIQALIEDRLDEQWDEVTTPEMGDMVLMKIRGRETHVGIYVLVKGVPHVLHALQDVGVIFLKQSQLSKINCSVVKYLRPKVNKGKPDEGASFDRHSNTSSLTASVLTDA